MKKLRYPIAATLAGLVLVLVLTAHAGAAPSKCQRLKGTDLAPARYIKLVERRNADDGTDLLGCGLPRGPVRTIASSADFFTTVSSYAIRQVAGRIVLIAAGGGNQYMSGTSLTVHDIRSGRSYSIAYSCGETGGGDCASGGSSESPVAYVTGAGRAVAFVFRYGTATTSVTAFNTLGTPRVLDSGPTADFMAPSLSLAGNVATWSHAGEIRSASIAPAS
jgi:hypothetical protein